MMTMKKRKRRRKKNNLSNKARNANLMKRMPVSNLQRRITTTISLKKDRTIPLMEITVRYV